ncbi:MAG: zf-TFIIB domain-containing protein [Planctomycetota bacterium]
MPDPLLCPKDRTPMDAIDAGGVEVDRCSTCGGIWLDLGELQQLADRAFTPGEIAAALDTFEPDDAETTSDKSTWLCPRDTARLTSMRDPQQPHIEYELCTHCGGQFFDAGELKDLSRLTLMERLKIWLPKG